MYPRVLTEMETLERALQGRSLARFGDGELRLAVGIPAIECATQVHHIGLQQELRMLLQGGTQALICLPRIERNIVGYDRLWRRFLHRKWCRLFAEAEYGSSFISRPDAVPGLATFEYWRKLTGLWHDRDVTLVIGKVDARGKDHSLVARKLMGARSIRVVYGPSFDAYNEIERIDADIGMSCSNSVVLLCLGATATCLAERVARRGIQALDLGHIGRFLSKQIIRELVR